jgi:uncharacterized protein
MFNDYLREIFGQRVQRISLHSGLTCPNRDGTCGTEGCIYCNNLSFNPETAGSKSIRDQLLDGMQKVRSRYHAKKFIAYFQTFSNTYAPLEILKDLYESALQHPDIVGLIISTRPDCVPDETLKLITQIAAGRLLWLELGIQSIHDSTLHRIGRGHSSADSRDAVMRAKKLGMNVAAHVILGLPGETEADMMATADALRELNIDGIKLHHLHAVKNTELERMYDRGEWTPLEAGQYIRLASQFLKRLPEGVVIMRLVSDCPESLLVAPKWRLTKQQIIRLILSA